MSETFLRLEEAGPSPGPWSRLWGGPWAWSILGELIFCIGKTENRVLPKSEILMEISDEKLGFEWKPHSERMNIRTFLNLCDPLWGPSEVHFFKKCWSTKSSKIVEQHFSPKGPKSISMDSGHLDKPCGPLIFSIFLIFWGNLFDRFLGNSCLFWPS